MFLLKPIERWKTSSWERNSLESDIIQYTQIATDKCFCSQVAIKQSSFFSANDSFKNIPRPNWEIQMHWENDL